MKILDKIRRKWIKLRYRSIDVFVFHQVSDVFDKETTWPADWTQTEQFKKNILALKRQYTFISLPEAYEKLQHDWFRVKKYAVLTSDDGAKNLLGILPWLEEQKVPVTLFINGKYLDGKSYSFVNTEIIRRGELDVKIEDIAPKLYMTKDELWSLTSPYIFIGSHGYEHSSACRTTMPEFVENVEKNMEVLSEHPRYIPFFAYPWGNATMEHLRELNQRGLISCMCSGGQNYSFAKQMFINRISIDGTIINQQSSIINQQSSISNHQSAIINQQSTIDK